jgi:3-deoxy-D-manno-octulosonate 8-phosphate phosphatase (KDO 8-P phosphatase)
LKQWIVYWKRRDAVALLTREKFLRRIRPVKLIVLDVDGVLTDDMLYIGPEGLEFKRFFVSDGLAIRLLTRLGIETGVISARYSPATVARMNELEIKYVYQDRNKMACFEDILRRSNLTPRETIFMGNDILDIEVMKLAGTAVAPSNAEREVVRVAHFKTKRAGGEGAVRDLYELVALAHRKKLVDLL